MARSPLLDQITMVIRCTSLHQFRYTGTGLIQSSQEVYAPARFSLAVQPSHTTNRCSTSCSEFPNATSMIADDSFAHLLRSLGPFRADR